MLSGLGTKNSTSTQLGISQIGKDESGRISFILSRRCAAGIEIASQERRTFLNNQRAGRELLLKVRISFPWHEAINRIWFKQCNNTKGHAYPIGYCKITVRMRCRRTKRRVRKNAAGARISVAAIVLKFNL